MYGLQVSVAICLNAHVLAQRLTRTRSHSHFYLRGLLLTLTHGGTETHTRVSTRALSNSRFSLRGMRHPHDCCHR